MSKINQRENFWSKIETNCGFVLGELVVFSAGSGVGKTRLFADEATKECDHNGPQQELDLDHKSLKND